MAKDISTIQNLTDTKDELLKTYQQNTHLQQELNNEMAKLDAANVPFKP